MSNFRIGDRVKFSCREEVGIFVTPRVSNENIKDGDIGTVVDLSLGYIGVEFDRHISGHTCEGCSLDGHGYYFDERTDLDLLNRIGR